MLLFILVVVLEFCTVVLFMNINLYLLKIYHINIYTLVTTNLNPHE